MANAINPVTLEALQKILSSAFIEAKLDSDGDLYASEGIDFPFFVSIEKSGEILKFFSYIDFKDSHNVNLLQALSLANRYNSSYLPLTMSVLIDGGNEIGRLCATDFLPIKEGITDQLFVSWLRRCASSFRASLSQLDEDDLLP